MKESKFIEQNKEKWEKLERMIELENSDPNVLSDLFIQLTDDLSYSRTFYHNRSVRAYLNNLTRKIFEKIYINKRTKKGNIFNFWKQELPSIMYECRRELLISFLIFIGSMLIGVFSSVVDPDFSKMILGSDYIDMTMENIESGDPMAVYKKMNQVDMFLGITWNNVLVAFRTFIFGVFLGLGTLFILIYNGIMVGTFQFFFLEKGLFWDSFLTIWIHGTLEISSIVIAGAAGLVFGKGFLFPGTLTRLQSFQLSAVRALKIFIGIVPIFILAGILESFVTRYTDVSMVLRASIILLSAFFIIYYFVILPFKVKSNTFRVDLAAKSGEKNYEGEKALKGWIKNISEILNLTFNLYQIRAKAFMKVIFVASLVTIPAFLFYIYDEADPFFLSGEFLSHLSILFNYSEYPLLFMMNTLIFALVFFIFSGMVVGERSLIGIDKKSLVRFLKMMVIAAVLNAVLFIPSGPLAIIVLIGSAPYTLNWAFVAYKSDKGIFSAFSFSFQLLKENAGRLWGTYASTLILSAIIFLFFNSPIFLASTRILEWNLPLEPEKVSFVINVFNYWLGSFLIYMLVPIIYMALAINVYSLEEIFTAEGLQKRITNSLAR